MHGMAQKPLMIKEALACFGLSYQGRRNRVQLGQPRQH